MIGTIIFVIGWIVCGLIAGYLCNKDFEYECGEAVPIITLIVCLSGYGGLLAALIITGVVHGTLKRVIEEFKDV